MDKTRHQLIREEREKLMKIAVKDGFYLYEIGEIFKLTKVRVCQILKAEPANSRKAVIKKINKLV